MLPRISPWHGSPSHQWAESAENQRDVCWAAELKSQNLPALLQYVPGSEHHRRSKSGFGSCRVKQQNHPDRGSWRNLCVTRLLFRANHVGIEQVNTSNNIGVMNGHKFLCNAQTTISFFRSRRFNRYTLLLQTFQDSNTTTGHSLNLCDSFSAAPTSSKKIRGDCNIFTLPLIFLCSICDIHQFTSTIFADPLAKLSPSIIPPDIGYCYSSPIEAK